MANRHFILVGAVDLKFIHNNDQSNKLVIKQTSSPDENNQNLENESNGIHFVPFIVRPAVSHLPLTVEQSFTFKYHIL